MNAKQIIFIGALLGMLGVAFGAFGAHVLDSKLPQWYPDPDVQIRKLDTWNIGVRYQMYSALAMIATGAIALQQHRGMFVLSSWLFVGGVLLFSGSLYILVLGDIKIFGMVAALGGMLQIFAWLALLVAALQLRIDRSARPTQEHDSP